MREVEVFDKLGPTYNADQSREKTSGLPWEKCLPPQGGAKDELSPHFKEETDYAGCITLVDGQQLTGSYPRFPGAKIAFWFVNHKPLWPFHLMRGRGSRGVRWLVLGAV